MGNTIIVCVPMLRAPVSAGGGRKKRNPETPLESSSDPVGRYHLKQCCLAPCTGDAAYPAHPLAGGFTYITYLVVLQQIICTPVILNLISRLISASRDLRFRGGKVTSSLGKASLHFPPPFFLLCGAGCFSFSRVPPLAHVL